MKRKIFTFLTLFLFSFMAVFAQEKAVNENGNYKNVIRIKIQDNLVNQFDALHQKKSQTTNKLVPADKGFVQTNVKSLDFKNQELNAVEYKRVFRYAGKFEQRHREFGLHKWYEISFNSKNTVKQLLDAYKGLEDVEFAEPVSKKSLVQYDTHPKAKNNAKALSTLPDDPYFSEQWHYHNTGQSGGTADADIDLPEAWELETGNTNVIVAIEDEGVDYSHEDLAGNMWVNTGEIPNNGIDDDNNGYVDDYYGYNFGDNKGPISPGSHGTHVGGTVAAETNNGTGLAGIAGGTGNNDGVRLMSVQVFGANSQGGFAEGFIYAADMGAHISQNSWGGGGESQSINDAIDYFIANGGGYGSPMNGGVVIVAAGNSNVSSGASIWPAAYPNAIAVASTDHNDVKSSFSNYGSWVDISAPGSDIASCAPDNGYQYMSGTSMACPHVSGVAALIVSHFAGNITPQGVRDLLINNADPIDNLNPSYSGQLGSGRLNAYASLNGGGTPPPPEDEYCSSKGNDASYEWISNVEIGNYSNSSGGAGYTDFTSENIELNAGESYSITLIPGFGSSSYDEYWKIWIDYNNDFSFTSDELVFDAGSLSSTAVNGTISIPAGTEGTSTRMRISMKYNGEPTACETFDYGEVEDYTVTITSDSGEDTEAPTAPSNLTASNITETTVDLSWNASTDNVAVTGYDVYQNGNLLGSVENNSANVTGLTVSTTYEFYVKAKDAAGNISAASNTISVTTSDQSGGEYCASQGENSSYEWIAEVNIGTYSNSSGAAGYSDFTGEIITLNAGSSVDISLVPGFSGSTYNEYWKIWIDYNGDKEFTSDELAFDAGSLSKTTINGTINVPSTASGTTRMRVSMKYNGAQTACETFSYGEVEDYTVTFSSGGGEDTEAPSAPANLASSNITQTTVDLSWNASTDNVGVTGYDVYQNGSLLGSVENNSANVTGLNAGTTYNYYVKAKDAAGNVSAASNTISVTTLSDNVEYCESKGNNSSYEWIDLVELNEMSNATGNDGGYTDYTNLTATVSRGAEQTIYVSCGFSGSSYTEYWHVWIDWDHSGTFDTDEKMVSGSSSSADKLSATFTVPSDAQLGTTRMRVTMKYNAAATACESFSYGEVEDYTINVTSTGSYSFTSFTEATELGNEIPTDISVYPNPAIDDITVTVANGTRVGTISIYNMIGSLIKIEEINGNRKEIDISDLPAGSYIISVEDEKEPITKQFIKQ